MAHFEQKKTRSDDPDWWRGAVIYQIYPRSFQDTNADGIGDLAGIIHRLPHVANLGADAVWISPFFRSPMADFGYDVSDYHDVDPMFGTIEDFDALIERAHDLGLKVLIDLVLSHSSNQHPWFKESRLSRDNARADWYVWADPKPDGTPPNNWLSIFGGSAWEWDGERMQYYLHNFLREQPDLNFHCPDVQDALLEVVRYWLDRGVDGFRLDTINFYVHDKSLKDNPALADEARNDAIAPSVNPYNFQDHLHDKNQPENLDFLRRFRAVLDDFPGATSVGEVGDAQRGAQIQAQYTSGDDKVHMCYDFSLLSGIYLTGSRLAMILSRFDELGPDGWACWAYSNHDVVRHRTRWNFDEQAYRVYSALLCSIKGTICLYQGEELGLTEAYVAFEELQDPYGKNFWPKFKGRDGCRTPMPWHRDNQQGGFSDGKPWLPVAMEHLEHAVDVQASDPDSTLAFYRAMIAYRKSRPVLAKGTIEFLDVADEALSFIRAHDGSRMFCAFNLSGAEQRFDLPDGMWQADDEAPFQADIAGRSVFLPPCHAFFAIEATASDGAKDGMA